MVVGEDSGDGGVSITSMDDSLVDGDPFADPEDMAPEDEVDNGGYEFVQTDVIDEYLSGYTDPDQEAAEDPVGYAVPSAIPALGSSMPGGGLAAAAVAALVALAVFVVGAVSGGDA
jgi:hypothetical protein